MRFRDFKVTNLYRKLLIDQERVKKVERTGNIIAIQLESMDTNDYIVLHPSEDHTQAVELYDCMTEVNIR